MCVLHVLFCIMLIATPHLNNLTGFLCCRIGTFLLLVCVVREVLDLCYFDIKYHLSDVCKASVKNIRESIKSSFKAFIYLYMTAGSSYKTCFVNVRKCHYNEFQLTVEFLGMIRPINSQKGYSNIVLSQRGSM